MPHRRRAAVRFEDRERTFVTAFTLRSARARDADSPAGRRASDRQDGAEPEPSRALTGTRTHQETEQPRGQRRGEP